MCYHNVKRTSLIGDEFLKLIFSGNELSIVHPELVKEWDYNKNAPINPDMVTIGSDQKYWWICEQGHHYEASVSHRSSGQNCPFCSNKKVLKGYNDLSTTHPEIAAEWDYNENLLDPNSPDTPDSVVAGCNKKVHWICEKGHKWVTSANHRTCKGGKGPTGCPKCASIARSISKTKNAAIKNNLATLYPHIAAQWHPTKNIGFDVNEIPCSSNRKFWWKCDICGNEWQSTVNHRIRKSGLGCPRCSKTGSSFPEQAIYYYITKFFSDAEKRNKTEIGMELDIFIPSIKAAIEYDGYLWHKDNKSLRKDNDKDELCREKNILLIRFRDPRLPDTNSAIRITSKDSTENELTSSISELFKILNIENYNIDVKRDYYKIIDAFKAYIIANSLEFLHPELLEEWDYNKNIPLPSQVTCYRKEKFWWKCKTCGHEWQTNIEHRIRGSGCPKCSAKRGAKMRSESASVNNNFALKYPELLKQWHPTKNKNLDPHKLSSGSDKKAWWLCPICGHEWKVSIAVRTRGNGCPECGKEKQRINRLSTYVKRSNLEENYPELCKEWHPTKNGSHKPSEYASGTDSFAWWICPKCGYEWEANISSRALNGVGCPVCSSRTVVPGKNDLATINPQLAAEWHPTKNGYLTPQMVTPSANKKIWWKCEKGHEWESMLNSRSQGAGCPYCYGRFPIKGENDLATLRPDVAEYWNYEKNGDKKPEDFKCSSDIRVWWKCKECGKEWTSTIVKRCKAKNICPNFKNHITKKDL